MTGLRLAFWHSTLSGKADVLTHWLGQVRRSDVMSAWSGIRPLASDPNASDTASASRDHVVSMDTDGMITIAGCSCACVFFAHMCLNVAL